MNETEDKIRKREKRKVHIRKRIYGTAERPRMTVYKSNRYIYMQAIDDSTGKTLAAASSLEKELKSCERNVEGGAKLGEVMGARLKEKNIAKVVFDRNGYLYHGVVKAMAEGARKAGIEF
jgi:large subunit ribosomal protein L18